MTGAATKETARKRHPVSARCWLPAAIQVTITPPPRKNRAIVTTPSTTARPCAEARTSQASDMSRAPRRRPSTLAMPEPTIADAATSSMEKGKTSVTAPSASGPTKAPSSIASATISIPLTMVTRMIGRLVRIKTEEIDPRRNELVGTEAERFCSLISTFQNGQVGFSEWALALPPHQLPKRGYCDQLERAGVHQ
ncbi:hypothetical protein AGR5A_Lc30009 [Agrobacterium genomosp. 5 str. CFBP 6626]|nr:hypothetical protein AGR5A_Lc30009 [Agrobacterium genomosp. 5 str. CFBP 6626]